MIWDLLLHGKHVGTSRDGARRRRLNRPDRLLWDTSHLLRHLDGNICLIGLLLVLRDKGAPRLISLRLLHLVLRNEDNVQRLLHLAWDYLITELILHLNTRHFITLGLRLHAGI